MISETFLPGLKGSVNYAKEDETRQLVANTYMYETTAIRKKKIFWLD